MCNEEHPLIGIASTMPSLYKNLEARSLSEIAIANVKAFFKEPKMTFLDETIAQIREAYSNGNSHSEIEQKVKDVLINYAMAYTIDSAVRREADSYLKEWRELNVAPR